MAITCWFKHLVKHVQSCDRDKNISYFNYFQKGFN